MIVIKNLAVHVGVLCSIFCAPSLVAQLKPGPLTFDMEGRSAATAPGAVRVLAIEDFTAQRGYGWVRNPSGAFDRPRLSRSRDAFTIDGVIGPDMEFKAAVSDGEWWLTVWVEAGMEDSSTVSIAVNGTPVQHDLHPFRTPSEPRLSIRNIYRIFSERVSARGAGLSVFLSGAQDSVRLLGLSLIPFVGPASAGDHAFLDTLRAYGTYGSGVSPSQLKSSIDRALQKKPDDPFVLRWASQAALLAKAEALYDMMGWEWATRKMGFGIFDRYQQAVMCLDAVLNHRDATSSPLYERALFYRARFLYWLGEEQHGPNEMSGGKRDFEALHRLHPTDPLLSMYVGEQIPSASRCNTMAPAERAPLWSKLQYEAICRLRDEIHWWVNVRQAENGELGGKLGDDVELFRAWSPIALLGDETTLLGWKKLADEIWTSYEVLEGYSKTPLDVEHAAEFIADTAPELVVFSDDPVYLDRLSYSARYFRDLWTAVNPTGQRLFRSAWFSSTEVDMRPPRDRDVGMNTRATKAVRYYAWKSRDTKTITAMHEWASTWAATAMKADKGKPPGIIPPSIRWSDGSINGDGQTWYIADMFWPYFEWDHNSGSMMMDQLYFMYCMTDDVSLLQPMLTSLELISRYANGQRGRESPRPGSEQWAATVLAQNAGFWNTVGEWRSRSGDKRFDDLILRYGTPYARYRVSGDITHLTSALEEFLSVLRYNVPLRTSEVLHTDRVHRGTGANDLKAMVSGSGVNEGMSPYLGVSWERADPGFTALVKKSTPSALEVEVFSHGAQDTRPTMRIWQLHPGKYSMRVETEGRAVREVPLLLAAPGSRFEVDVPSRALVRISIEPAS